MAEVGGTRCSLSPPKMWWRWIKEIEEILPIEIDSKAKGTWFCRRVKDADVFFPQSSTEFMGRTARYKRLSKLTKMNKPIVGCGVLGAAIRYG